MSQSSNVTAGVDSKVIAFLAPLFLDATGGDQQAARLTAIATLDSHKPRNDTELRLAVLITAFGIDALSAMSRAANPEPADSQVLRLQANAAALSRAPAQDQKLPDLLRAEDPPPEQQDLPASTAIPDLVAFARAAGAPL